MNFIKKYSNFIILGLIVISIIFLFLPCGAYVYGASGEFKDYVSSGFQMIFGRKGDGYAIFEINILGICMLLLMLFAIIISLTSKIIDSKYTSLLQFVIIGLASFFYYILPSSVNHGRFQINDRFQGEIAVYIGATILLLAGIFALCVFLSNILATEEKVK